jgi:ubiquinone/menaquinone biosynthesis C-methylase UbiE
MAMSESAEIARHYSRSGLVDRVLAALKEAGKDIDHLTIDDLAPIDEFHSRRRLATEELARMLAPKPGQTLIDVGSGLGGPSRYLAKVCGCRVSGVDLTPEFVATATELARRTGLSDKVDFRQGSALELPFADGSFDLAWSQNVAMNIADRPRYYAQMRRVLVPGGRLAIQDVAQGPASAPYYPVMWADTPATSFLRAPEETRAMLEAAGFKVLAWNDNTDAAIAEAKAERARQSANPGERPILGIHVVVGPSFSEKARNGQRSMLENRIRLINAVLSRE